MPDSPTSKRKKHWKRAMTVFLAICAFVFIFDLAPFTTAGLFDQSNVRSIYFKRYMIYLPKAENLTGHSEWVDPVHVTDADGLSRVREILSKYQFRRNLFSPQRSYTRNVSIIHMEIPYDDDKYFTLEITDPTAGSSLWPGSLLSISKYWFAVGNRDYSIDYVGHRQQDKLYGELDNFINGRLHGVLT
jgi:hypothetical protein